MPLSRMATVTPQPVRAAKGGSVSAYEGNGAGASKIQRKVRHVSMHELQSCSEQFRERRLRPGEQGIGCALLANAAALEHDHTIRATGELEPVGDDDRRATLHHGFV